MNSRFIKLVLCRGLHRPFFCRLFSVVFLHEGALFLLPGSKASYRSLKITDIQIHPVKVSMGCSLFLYYYCIFHYMVSTYLNSQCTSQRHCYNEGHRSPWLDKKQDPLSSLQMVSLKTLGHVFSVLNSSSFSKILSLADPSF